MERHLHANRKRMRNVISGCEIFQSVIGMKRPAHQNTTNTCKMKDNT
ncbi:MAG: hypothetical protein H3C36_07965 [Chitinophagaceae bacterium]|nr:hypothetical protein [Chitinophagaceae bacterium]MCW5915648.1 hypothetical protein [Chitinophagaceae bacterium]MCZ2397437.1 hypothetical protein [Chitinophagales bacterium]